MLIESDFLVIGSGIAGLSFALKAAKLGRVTLVTKDNIDEGSTKWAQGGIASVFSEDDSFESHIKDTLDAGDGLCNLDAVTVTVTEGPARVRELIELGVEFNKKETEHHETDTDYDLTREGGHRARRILHASDFTGVAIINALVDAVRKEPNITVLDHHIAIDLITTKSRVLRKPKKNPEKVRNLGAYVMNIRKHQIHTLSAPVTVLATGGAGKVYRYTTNPDTATGDGIAMAYRAGARIANMEFIQFHPTCLYVSKEESFLISEALRGEGGILRNKSGEAFMTKYHEMKDLAPRDVVSRAIDTEMKRHGLDCVYLDMTHLDGEYLKKRFPNIYAHCFKLGIDMRSTPIPVVPAAHYTCGGVLTDLDGESTIENLYAIGETASTGLHGANRLASNSLLEGVVFADRAAKSIAKKAAANKNFFKSNQEMPDPLPLWDSGFAVPMEEQINIHHTWRELRTLMWNYVSIVRSNRRLLRAKARVDLLKHEIQEYYWNYLLTKDLIELRNISTIADLIIECASERKESRGLHYNTDFPTHDDRFFLKDTII